MKQRILAMLLFGLLGVMPAFAQEREITGRVVDSKGEAMPGVIVLVVETKTGNATDIDGRFTVKASTGNTLKFTFIGYKEQEVKVGAENSINATLEENNQLAVVVVTGYRDEDASKFSGSAGVVSSKSLDQVPIASFDQILQGRTPGIQGGTGSGQPGSSASILIRGQGSLNSGTDPLYIIDGVPVASDDFASINANDFESVTVLKDASSTSKYGSRGANGVIVAKSKKGKNGKTQLNYRFMQGITTRTTSKFSNMDTPTRLKYERMLAQHDVNNGSALFNAWATVPIHRQHILGTITDAQYEQQLQPFASVDTDWKKEMFRTGHIQSHDFNATGGNEKTNFYIGAQYRREEGIIEKSNLDRYTLRINVNHNASDKFRFGINTSIGYSNQSLIASELGSTRNPVWGMYLALPYRTPQSTKAFFINAQNPVVTLGAYTRKNDNYKMVGSVYAEYDFTKNLTLRTNWGGDFSMDIFKQSISSKDIRFPSAPSINQNQVGLSETGLLGSISRQQELANSFVGTTSLTYAKVFADKHDVTASANFEILANNENAFSYTGYGINAKFIDTPFGITQGSSSNPYLALTGGRNTLNRLASAFADIAYTYDKKYNVAIGIRRDGSSRFGLDKRYGTFYSIGASWNMMEEAFMANLSNIVTDGKLRVTYGAQGNQDIADFGYLATYQAGGNYAGQQGFIPNVPGNSEVQWESQTTFNVGLDFALLKNKRIIGTIEYYNRATKDLFVAAQVTRTTGFTSINRNIGSMRNRGLELNLSADVLKVGDFTWSVNVIHTLNRNKIISLGAESEYVAGTSIVRVGLPYGSHYIVKWSGVNPATGDPLYYDKEGNVTPTYNTANNIPVGTFVAPKFGSFTNTFRYKGLELSVFFVYEAGKALFNNQNYFSENVQISPLVNSNARLLNAWMTPGQITDIPRLNAARQFSTRDIEDGSFLRLRNVTLAYNVPAAWAKNLKMRSVRAYVMGQNVLTFTKFTGFDPEDNNNIQLAQFPVPRTFTFGVDLGF